MLPCPRSCALKQKETMNKFHVLIDDDIGDVIGACCLDLLKKNATSIPASTKSQFINFAPWQPLRPSSPIQKLIAGFM